MTIIFLLLIGHTNQGVKIMEEKKKENGSKKSATDNKWVSTGQARPNDKSDRRDGPGGEDAD